MRRPRSSCCCSAALQQRHDQQRHDVDDLDERVDRRAGGVLVGIADGVAGDGRLVRVRALAAVVAFLDVLLGVVPGAAAGGHRNRHEDTGDDRAHEHAAERLHARARTHQPVEQHDDDDWHQHRQQRRNNHFLDRRLGEHVHGLGIIRFGFAFHDAGNFLELAADLDHDRAGGATDRLHAHGAEQVRHHAADEQADDDRRIGKRELDELAGVLQFVGVVGEQHQRRETGGADGVALGHGLGGVADGVEWVGDGAHFLRQVRHFGNAAGVVGDRAIGVERDDDAGHAEHRGRGDGDAVQAAELIRAPDRQAHRQHRQRRRLHGHAQAGDDVGAVAGGRGLRDVAHRAVLGGGVVLGDDDHRRRERQADERGVVEVQGRDAFALDRHVVAEHAGGNEIERDRRQHAGDDQAAVERVHDLAAHARLDEEGADHRGDDGHAAEHQRIERGVRARGREQQAAQQHGGDDGDGVGLEQVRGHAGAVADVVADVVGDHRRIARVVLGDAGLDLAHQIGADVGALGEDAAAETGEDRNQRTAEAEAYERRQRDRLTGRRHCRQHPVVTGYPQQPEADHEQAGDGAAAERNLQRRIQPLARRLGGAHVGAHRDVHADVAGHGREHRADGEADGGELCRGTPR